MQPLLNTTVTCSTFTANQIRPNFSISVGDFSWDQIFDGYYRTTLGILV